MGLIRLGLTCCMMSILLVGLQSCRGGEPDTTLVVNRLALRNGGLADLPAGYEYVVTLSDAGQRTEIGRFSRADHDPMLFSFSGMQVSDGAVVNLSIEASGVAAPQSGRAILTGELIGDSANLSFTEATGISVENARIQYILETPSTAEQEDYNQGVYWCVPGSIIGIDEPVEGPPEPEVVPVLPAGWVYEGWIVDSDGQQISTGRFPEVMVPDSDGNGPAAGPAPGLPFPGQEFIDPPLVLPGMQLWLTIEPEPDFSADHSGIILFRDTLIEDLGPLVQQSISVNNGELGELPSGFATFSLQ